MERQAREAREQQIRSKRASVYFTFTKTADAYAQMIVNRYSPEILPEEEKNFTYAEQEKARQAYLAAYEAVYVYGSDEAWKAAGEMASNLTPISSINALHFEERPNPTMSSYNATLNKFRAVMCAELPSVPRNSCGTPISE
ncbi:hypothetical protein [Nonomuraea harbinensis]|uniref:Uncharacterized protein n=1 Tax=Nonomuraea harbinensis TaxID=1286938 RepID=A0ABW1C8B0_9ACTN|nr:hypothetical protein [Nonomuraea harbinensis]